MRAALQEISGCKHFLAYTHRMNFLAHLHLASLAQSSLLGNLMADFVRGNPDGQFAPPVVAGIRLHRRIDVITDSHPEVKAAKLLFSQAHRRVAPIALDVVWDHFLARHWARLASETPLRQFVQAVEDEITPALPDTPQAFQALNHYLWQERWLERYADLAFLARVFNGMASRRPRLIALSTIYPEIEQRYSALEACFWRLYPDMMAKARLGVDAL